MILCFIVSFRFIFCGVTTQLCGYAHLDLSTFMFMLMLLFILILGDEDGLGGMFDCGVIRLVD